MDSASSLKDHSQSEKFLFIFSFSMICEVAF
jgi:hypothetical protein